MVIRLVLVFRGLSQLTMKSIVALFAAAVALSMFTSCEYPHGWFLVVHFACIQS